MGLAGEWWFLEAKRWVKVEMQWSEVSGRDLVGLGMKDEREREREYTVCRGRFCVRSHVPLEV